MPQRRLIVFFFIFYLNASYAQTISRNATGLHDGFYYSFWNDRSNGIATMTLGPGGHYAVSWTDIGNFTAGKGWRTGQEDRVICYSGKFDGGTNGFLALYGWTRDSLVEYYVVENYGEWTPPGAESLGTLKSDGGIYNIFKTRRIDKPSIIGTATFYQFWSVRTDKRSSGQVTFSNHVKAWKENGMYLGKTWDYQIMETEGYKSSGFSEIQVGACTSDNKP